MVEISVVGDLAYGCVYRTASQSVNSNLRELRVLSLAAYFFQFLDAVSRESSRTC